MRSSSSSYDGIEAPPSPRPPPYAEGWWATAAPIPFLNCMLYNFHFGILPAGIYYYCAAAGFYFYFILRE
jgi:hypothetical protein